MPRCRQVAQRKTRPVSIYALTFATAADPENFTALKIGDDGEIFVPLLDGLLVDADETHDTGVTRSRPRLTARLMIASIVSQPTSKSAGNRRRRHLQKQRDGVGLETFGHVGPAFGPGNGHRVDAIVWTVDAWDNGMDEKLIAAQVEVPPDAFTMIVLGRITITDRASPCTPPFNRDVDALELDVEGGISYLPRRFNPQKRAQKLQIAHTVNITSTASTPVADPPELLMPQFYIAATGSI